MTTDAAAVATPDASQGQQAAGASDANGTQAQAAQASGTVDGQQQQAQQGNEQAQGQQPAGNGNEQQPNLNASSASTAVEPKRYTAEEWAQQSTSQQAIETRRRNQEEWDRQSRDLHSKGPVMARDLLDTLASDLGITIPPDKRKPILDHFDTLLSHADRGAELKYKDDYEGYKQDLEDTAIAFFSALTAEERPKFTAAVRDKEPKVWVETLLNLRTPGIKAEALKAFTDAAGQLLPEGAARDGYAGEVAKAGSDPKKLAQVFHDALVGVVGPGGTPRVQPRGAAGNDTLAEVTRKRSEGYYKTDEDFLKAQNAALGIKEE